MLALVLAATLGQAVVVDAGIYVQDCGGAAYGFQLNPAGDFYIGCDGRAGGGVSSWGNVEVGAGHVKNAAADQLNLIGTNPTHGPAVTFSHQGLLSDGGDRSPYDHVWETVDNSSDVVSWGNENGALFAGRLVGGFGPNVASFVAWPPDQYGTTLTSRDTTPVVIYGAAFGSDGGVEFYGYDYEGGPPEEWKFAVGLGDIYPMKGGGDILQLVNFYPYGNDDRSRKWAVDWSGAYGNMGSDGTGGDNYPEAYGYQNKEDLPHCPYTVTFIGLCPLCLHVEQGVKPGKHLTTFADGGDDWTCSDRGWFHSVNERDLAALAARIAALEADR